MEKENRLFIPATNLQAYLKCGILGFSGSGKTFTGTKIAIGLYEFMKAKKPVYFIDTETGSDFVKPLFDEKKIPLQVAKTRAFSDLLEGVREAEKNASILIIDSITHFWNELMESFVKKKEIKRILFHHWLPLKQEWRVFTDLFINSTLHILMIGRAGWEYSYEEDDEGTKELTKTGTKMKAEGEMGYEPSLLVEMEHLKAEIGKIGAGLIHRAWIVKDRTNTIQGKFFDNPDFPVFLPHINCLNIGGKHSGVDITRNSTALFDGPNSGSNIHKRREIAKESIENELVKQWPGQDKESKLAKIRVLEEVFGTNSWTAVSDIHPDKLEEGLLMIKKSPVLKDIAQKMDVKPIKEKEKGK